MDSNSRGLSAAKVNELLQQGKGNTQIENIGKTNREIIRENIFTYFNLIFFIMAILLVISGAWNSLTFLPVIICNALIGIFQGIKAKNILDRLKVLHQTTVTAIRDGEEKIVHVDKLVLGDVIVLSAGSQICADAVVLNGEISVNEALLTGEADEINKKSGDELMS